ncbi:MAG TPA: lauroyl acyltransferase, partial [Rhodospirillales bacterium]|nr:lauroyl acyltransferase [Rhodospirillales bacterium]
MFRAAGHAGEAAAAWFLYVCFSILPVDAASALGGWIGRTFGSRLSVSNNARRNLKSTYPDWSDHQVETIVISMWNNLGRTAGEHPHLSQFNPYQKNSRVEVVGFENCEKFLRANTPCLFFSGHIANWEIAPLAAKGLGLIMHLVYRRANNPFFDKLVQKGRNVLEGDFYPKGSDGAKGLLRALKRGANVAMLVDQKMNDGISVPFLGRNAMTAPALAELALRYKCPIVPA